MEYHLLITFLNRDAEKKSSREQKKKVWRLFIYFTVVDVREGRFFPVCVFEKAEMVVIFAPNRLNVEPDLDVGGSFFGGGLALGFNVGSKSVKI